MLVFIINYEILWWLIIPVYILIMIDVKLTPSGLLWTTYLFVWMDRRHAGLVWFCLLGELLEDSGSFLCFLSIVRVLDRLLSTMCLLCCWDFTHVSGFGYYFMWMYLRDDDMATWGVCYISAVMFLLLKFLCMSIVNYSKTWRLFLTYLLYPRDLSL